MRADRVLMLAMVLPALLVGGCRDYRVEEVAPLPARVEVQGPLQAQVVDLAKQPLPVSALPQLQRAGVRWDYTLQLTDTSGTGVRLEQLENVVQSRTGVTARETTTLPSRVEPRGTTPIRVRATLSTSDPAQPGNLQGVQTLTFRGQDDQGRPVEVVVRVPLE